MNLVVILGFIGLGAFVGMLSHLVLLERGHKILSSIGVSIFGALVGGIISIVFNLVGAGFYALICSFLVLFTFNVFRTEEDPVFD